MSTISSLDWISEAMAGGSVWNIGQLDAATVALLNKAVKHGALVKSRLSFCGISALKTVWHRPNVWVDTGAGLYAHDESVA